MKVISAFLLLALTTFAASSCGYKSPGNTAPTAGITPAIAQLIPANATHGSSAFTMTINGSNFSSSANATWNGTAFTTTFVTVNQVTIAVPASAIASAGTAMIVVTNPSMSGGIYGGGTLAESSNAMTFTIN
jgi:hypothetical protein